MRMLLIVALAAGCNYADEVEGQWAGACDFDGDEVAVSLDINSAKYGIVEGYVAFEWRDASWSGTIDGTHSEDVLELSIFVFFDGAIEWEGLFEGDLDGSELSGPMHLEGGDFVLDGTCFFEEG